MTAATDEIRVGQVRRHERTGLRVKITRQLTRGQWAGIYPDHADRGGKHAERTFQSGALRRFYPVEDSG